MVITYFGHEFFKVQFGDLTLAFNPVSKDSKLKGAKFGADIAFQSINTPETNGIDQVTFGERKPFAITGPGEYEVKDIFIKAFPGGKNKEGKYNTVFLVSLEGMNLVFLGAMPEKELSQEAKAALEDVDVLFVPIGGGDVLSAADAYKLAVSLEAKIVIPMHFDKNDAALKAFLKEGEGGETMDKLTLKKKDLEGKEGDIVVLTPTN
jgi:L-ascorbate metabolism protein UlaG (beta-lactamase superfamily)